MTPRRAGDPSRCKSGDGCDHLAAEGSKFCGHHRDELAQIAKRIAPRKFNRRIATAA